MAEFKHKTVKTNKDIEYLVFELPKEMPSDSICDFEKEMITLIQKDKNNIIIDFSNTSYICSRGVGILAYALGKARKKNGDIKLMKLAKFVKKLFEVIQLDQIFEIYETLDEIIEKN